MNRKLLTSVSTLLFGSLNFLTSSYSSFQPEQEEIESPRTPRGNPSLNIAPTPGQKLKEDFKKLNKEAFVEIFGLDLVESKLSQVNWNKLSDIDSSFDDNATRESIRTIRTFIRTHKVADDREKKSKFSDIQSVLLDFLELPKDRIKHYIEQYFGEEVEFHSKKGGDQLGAIVSVTDPKNSQSNVKTKFYVKTHAMGHKSQHSSGAQPVDLKELFIYKILEKLDLGCETHFFGKSLKEFYIATKDAASYGLSFQVYDLFRESVNTHTDDSIIKDIVQLDLISRLFRLIDLGTNFGNFGFVRIDETNNYKIKIIDFGFTQDASYQINRDHFNGLKEGNGSYNYTDSTMVDILKKQEENVRMSRAHQQFKVLYEKFKNTNTEVLTQEIMSTINNLESNNQEEINTLYQRLMSYQNDINKNFESFDKFFEEYFKTQSSNEIV